MLEPDLVKNEMIHLQAHFRVSLASRKYDINPLTVH